MLLLSGCRICLCYFSILFTFLNLLACASKPKSETQTIKKAAYHHDAELEPFVQAYLDDAEAAGVPVSKRFQSELVQIVWTNDLGHDGNGRVLGRCERFNEVDPDPKQRFRTIRLVRPDTDGLVGSIKVDSITLKTIVYHELGHCLHDYRGHLPEASHQIMSSALPDDRIKDFDEKLKKHFQLMRGSVRG
ncbi:MAG: hypothetical protein NTX25_22345 [Proteobacteria bacterium]|nr:hypothetical protein [Pseudomonadota bacterium]